MCLSLLEVFGVDPPLYFRDPLPPPLGLDKRAPFCSLPFDPPLDFDYFMTSPITEFLHYLAVDILKIGVCEEADKPKVSAHIQKTC